MTAAVAAGPATARALAGLPPAVPADADAVGAATAPPADPIITVTTICRYVRATIRISSPFSAAGRRLPPRPGRKPRQAP